MLGDGLSSHLVSAMHKAVKDLGVRGYAPVAGVSEQYFWNPVKGILFLLIAIEVIQHGRVCHILCFYSVERTDGNTDRG